jgi:hypothetical protein
MESIKTWWNNLSRIGKGVVIFIGIVVVLILVKILFFSSSPTPPSTSTNEPIYSSPPQPSSEKKLIVDTKPTPPPPSTQQRPMTSDEFNKRVSQSSAAIVTTCGPCTDNIYGVDCMKDSITYTCVAGKWTNFGKQKLIIASDKPRTDITKITNVNTAITVDEQIPDYPTNGPPIVSFIVCPEPTCKSSPTLKNWLDVDTAISAVSRFDPTFSSKVIPSTEQDLLTHGPQTSINGSIGMRAVRKDNGKLAYDNVLLSRGFWVTGPKPPETWLSYLRSKGIGFVF